MSRNIPRLGTLGDIDLRLLRVFVSVARNGGFAAAEVELNKARSAISVDIAALEERLGYRLCHRGRSGFALTAEGSIVLEAAHDLFANLSRFQDRLRSANSDLRGAATLILLENIGSVAAETMTRIIRQFRVLHPLVKLNIIAGSGADVEREILAGRADVGVSVLPRLVPEVQAIPLFGEDSLLYCGKTHALFPRAHEASLEEIAACSILESNALNDPPLDTIFTHAARMISSTALDCHILVLLAGVDVGFLPTHYAQRWVDRDELRALQPALLRRSSKFHLVTSRDNVNSRIRDALSSIVLECCGADT